MKIKEALFATLSTKYKDGLKDGIESEQDRIVKLIVNHALKHNAHPYFMDIIKLIESGEKK